MKPLITKYLNCKILLAICFSSFYNGLSAQDRPSDEIQNSLYQSYVRERSIENPDELLKAAQSLLDRDTQFAPAWVLTGKAYNSKSQMPHPKKEVFADSARIAAQKALELDSKSAEVMSFAALQDFLDGNISSSLNHQYALNAQLELSRGITFNILNQGSLAEAFKWSDASLTAYTDAVRALRYHGAFAYTLGFY